MEGGAYQIASLFLFDLNKRQESNIFHIVLSPSLANLIDLSNFSHNLIFYKLKRHFTLSIFSYLEAIRLLKSIERESNIQAVFTLFGPSYWRPKSFHLMGYAIPHYVYPESPFFNNLSFFENIKFKVKSMLQKIFIKIDADAYVVETDDVKLRLSKFLSLDSTKIFVVKPFVHPTFQILNLQREILIEYPKNIFKILVLSSDAKHKNLKILIECSEIIRNIFMKEVVFIMTLPNEFFKKNFNDSFFVNAGPVLIENCPSLYRQSDLILSTSMLECFSSIYIESMFMEKPLLASNIISSKKICDYAALYFNVEDPFDLAEKILKLSIDDNLRKKLVDSGKKRLLELTKFDGE